MAILIPLLLIATIALLIAGSYLLLLTVAGLFNRPAGETVLAPNTRFAVLVPAHNEELLLPDMLESLGNMDYPRGLFDVYVVADNCSDSTAAIARSHGTTVFERDDPVLKGKPYALRWLLEQIPDSAGYDAYVFIDADTVVSPNLLAVVDDRLRSGSSVVQVHYAVSNPSRSSVAALRFIAFELMNYVRPLGKQALGLSCGLFGTGMGFKRAVLDTYGWDAFTLAEDAEYSLSLVERGVRVDFAPEATVRSQMPASLRDAKGQNLRWERGRLLMAWKHGFPFVLAGILERNPGKLAAGLDQLIPPLSVTFMIAAFVLIVSAFTGRTWLVGLSLAANVALLAHLFVGLICAKAPLRVYRAFAFAPWFMVWKALVYLQALKPGEMGWARTERRRR